MHFQCRKEKKNIEFRILNVEDGIGRLRGPEGVKSGALLSPIVIVFFFQRVGQIDGVVNSVVVLIRMAAKRVESFARRKD